MKWSMLRDLSVHNTSLPFDHTCCLDKSEWERVSRFPVLRSRSRKPQSELSFLFPLPPTVQFDVVHQYDDLRHKPPTSSFVGFFGFILTQFFCFQGSFPISTSAHDSPTGSMSSPTGVTSRFRVVVRLTSALLCHTHCWSLWISILGSGKN